MECSSCIIAAHTCDRTRFASVLLSFLYIHYSQWNRCMFKSSEVADWATAQLCTTGRNSTLYITIQQYLAGQNWPPSASMWALLHFNLFFGSWHRRWQRKSSDLVARDFTTNVCLQAKQTYKLINLNCYGFTPSECIDLAFLFKSGPKANLYREADRPQEKEATIHLQWSYNL